MVFDYLMNICRKPCTALIYVFDDFDCGKEFLSIIQVSSVRYNMVALKLPHLCHSIRKFVKKYLQFKEKL